MFEQDSAAVMPMQTGQLVTQEIRYGAADASAVSLVWGGNGWSSVPRESRPAGTIVENGAMHTPMTPEGDTFVAHMQIPCGTAVDYGFQVTKQKSGTESEIVWDGDHELGAENGGAVELRSAPSRSETGTLLAGRRTRRRILLTFSVVVGVGIVVMAAIMQRVVAGARRPPDSHPG